MGSVPACQIRSGGVYDVFAAAIETGDSADGRMTPNTCSLYCLSASGVARRGLYCKCCPFSGTNQSGKRGASLNDSEKLANTQGSMEDVKARSIMALDRKHACGPLIELSTA